MLTYKIDEDTHLRLFNEDDAEEFFQLTIDSKKYLKEWLGWLDNIRTVEDTAANIKSRLNEIPENRGYPLSFAIIYKGKIAGTIGFNSIDSKTKTGVVGYWIGKDYQGKGIMTKAFKALLGYGFTELVLNRIEVRVAAENIKSKAIPERFGFKKEGVIRQAEWLYDHSVDHVLYSLLSTEWKY
ncbi:GNAT family protein [Carnobacteriaceae bacterium 52-44]